MEEGEDAGIAFDYAAIGRVPNTLTAHRLLDRAERVSGPGAQHVNSPRCCSASTSARVAMSGTSRRSARQPPRRGMDGGETRAYLASGVDEEDMRARIRGAFEVGVVSVPCYLLSGFMLPGCADLRRYGPVHRTREGEARRDRIAGGAVARNRPGVSPAIPRDSRSRPAGRRGPPRSARPRTSPAAPRAIARGISAVSGSIRRLSGRR